MKSAICTGHSAYGPFSDTSLFFHFRFIPNGFVFHPDDVVCLTSTKALGFSQLTWDSADQADLTIQQMCPVGSGRGSTCILLPNASLQSSLFLQITLLELPPLPSLRPFFPREPELKGRSACQFPSPSAARIPPTHACETKAAELSPMVKTQIHGAIMIPRLENPALFHPLVLPLYAHTQPH